MLEGWVSRTTATGYRGFGPAIAKFSSNYYPVVRFLSQLYPYSQGLRVSQRTQCGVTAWENGVASENNNFQFIVEFTIKTSIYRRLSIAKFDYQMDSDGTSMYIPFFFVFPWYPHSIPEKKHRWFLCEKIAVGFFPWHRQDLTLQCHHSMVPAGWWDLGDVATTSDRGIMSWDEKVMFLWKRRKTYPWYTRVYIVINIYIVLFLTLFKSQGHHDCCRPWPAEELSSTVKGDDGDGNTPGTAGTGYAAGLWCLASFVNHSCRQGTNRGFCGIGYE